MITHVLSPRLTEALGFTLLHALWQGALFALALALLLVALKRYSPQARYLVSVGLLAAFALTSVVTFGRLYTRAEAPALAPVVSGVTASDTAPLDGRPAGRVLQTTGLQDPTTPPTTATSTAPPLPQRFADYYERHLPLLVTLWLLGVLVMQLRWLGQLAYVQRLKHYGNEALPEAWRERLSELEAKLRIRKTVQYALSPRIESPMVIGWLRPVVLLPQEMFARLADTEVYAVLAHELAHVRRDDFAVNLLQSILTNVFFFHPGVWWMSGRADEEREQACDDLAVAALGGAIPYAKTLINVSELSLKPAAHAQPALAMALDGQRRRKSTGFTARVKRLFGSHSGTGSFREGFATACILFGALIAAGFATSQTANATGDGGGRDGFAERRTRVATDTLPGATDGDYDVDLHVDFHHDGDEDTETGVDRDLENPLDAYADNGLDPITARAVRTAPVDALNAAIVRGERGDVLEALLAAVADVNARDYEGYTPLAAAAHVNRVDVARRLLVRGAKVEGVSREGWSALTEAADEGALEVARLLIEAGADVNAVNARNGYGPLAIAAGNGHLAIVRLLAEKGARDNGPSDTQSRARGWAELRPPLHAAAGEGKTDVVRYLLDKGADIDLRDARGRTALMFAASEGQGDAVALLMSRRADPNVADKSGRRAVDYARAEDHDELASMLSLITAPTAPATAPKVGELQIERQWEMKVEENEQILEGLKRQEEQRLERMHRRDTIPD